jgi:hypothetical protein
VLLPLNPPRKPRVTERKHFPARPNRLVGPPSRMGTRVLAVLQKCSRYKTRLLRELHELANSRASKNEPHATGWSAASAQVHQIWSQENEEMEKRMEKQFLELYHELEDHQWMLLAVHSNVPLHEMEALVGRPLSPSTIHPATVALISTRLLERFKLLVARHSIQGLQPTLCPCAPSRDPCRPRPRCYTLYARAKKLTPVLAAKFGLRVECPTDSVALYLEIQPHEGRPYHHLIDTIDTLETTDTTDTTTDPVRDTELLGKLKAVVGYLTGVMMGGSQ